MLFKGVLPSEIPVIFFASEWYKRSHHEDIHRSCYFMGCLFLTPCFTSDRYRIYICSTRLFSMYKSRMLQGTCHIAGLAKMLKTSQYYWYLLLVSIKLKYKKAFQSIIILRSTSMVSYCCISIKISNSNVVDLFHHCLSSSSCFDTFRHLFFEYPSYLSIANQLQVFA